jgi:intein/homing endonuclease
MSMDLKISNQTLLRIVKRIYRNKMSDQGNSLEVLSIDKLSKETYKINLKDSETNESISEVKVYKNNYIKYIQKILISRIDRITNEIDAEYYDKHCAYYDIDRMF